LISELLRKWFGLTPMSCPTCEVLRDQLAYSEKERRELLAQLLDKGKTEPPPEQKEEEFIPITPQHVPWRVRQQLMEQEDRKAAQLLKQSAQDIAALEQELGINKAVERGPSGGVKVEVK